MTDNDGDVGSASIDVTISDTTPITVAPVIFNLDATKTINVASATAGVILDTDVATGNPDGTGFSGGNLVVSITGMTADDVLRINDVGPISVSAGVDVQYNGRSIGTMSRRYVSDRSHYRFRCFRSWIF